MTAHPEIVSSRLVVGLEVHVELATRTKMFSTAPSPAHREHEGAAPNTLIDATVLALPGALPVMNGAAVEMAVRVGLALGCQIAAVTKWDRKSYFYPDLPKNYQISQYDLPLCFDGSVDLPGADNAGHPDPASGTRRIGIIRAHLEEDAGKLLHEAPGGHAIDFSIADYNRAGTPLLEIVTQPDFSAADEAVLFARVLRTLCRFLGVTEGVMQKGHMRFEPNINCHLTLADGRLVKTPIVEIKNLNSFRSLKGAIEYEAKEQPARWRQDGREMGRGSKVTRGWDDVHLRTYVQREKEDAHDYRYFPDPDLVPLRPDPAWVQGLRGALPELPLARGARYVTEWGLSTSDAVLLTEERAVSDLYESAVDALTLQGVPRLRSGKAVANLVVQSAMALAGERGVGVEQLGLSGAGLAAVAKLREDGDVGNQAVTPLLLAAAGGAGESAEGAYARLRDAAARAGLLVVRDEAAMDAWIDAVIAEHGKVADDVRAGKLAAAGRLVGEVMKRSGGSADAKTVRERILKRLGQG